LDNSTQRHYLPAVRITPQDVISYCDKRWQHPSEEEAKAWLSKNRRSIAQLMRSHIEANMDNILDEATIDGYPDQVFDEQYSAVDRAISDAAGEYGETIGKDHYGSSEDCSQMLRAVSRLVENPSDVFMCIEYENEFGDDDACEVLDRTVTHRTKRVHINRDAGNLKVEIVESSTCIHGAEVFVLESEGA